MLHRSASVTADPNRRVLLVQYSGNSGGSTISGLLIASGLIRAGWQVDVAFGFSGPFVARYEKAGCRVHVLPHDNWLGTTSLLAWTRRLIREAVVARRFTDLMRTVNPAVVYINTLVSMPAALAARGLSVPCVWHIREQFDDVGGEMRCPRGGGRWLVRWLLTHLSTRLVAISRAVAENVLGKQVTSRLHVIPNAVSSDYFDHFGTQQECRRELGLPEGVPLVGVPGTLRPVKGHPFFLEAAALIAGERSEVQFAVTGEGALGYRDQLRAQVAKTELDGRIRFTGTLADMRKFYRACDVVCVPSRSEPFGRTVIEAFGVGTPVIATSVGGICETVDDEVTGLLVKYGDTQGMAERIIRLLDAPCLCQRLVDRARGKAKREYCEEIHHARICSLVNEVANGSIRRSAGCAASGFAIADRKGNAGPEQ